MSRVIKFLVLTLIVALAVGLAGCAETAPPTEKLQILSHSMSTDQYGYPVVQGTAKNVSSTNFSYAFINVKFYDASGAAIATLSDYICDLGPGETWNFEVTCNEKNAQSYKITVKLQ